MRKRIRHREKPRRGARSVARASAALLLTACAVFAVGCQSAQVVADQMSLAPVVPPRGLFYSHFRAPLILPSMREEAPDGPAPESPRRLVYLKIPYANVDFSTGRAGLAAAARNAGLHKVLYADYEYRSVLGYFQTITIHAWGVSESP